MIVGGSVNFLKLFFSFYGRVGRAVYWVGIAVNFLAMLTLFLIVDSVVMRSGGTPPAVSFKTGALAVAAALSVMSMLSLHVRRAHDRGLSGWLGLAGYGAIGAGIWWTKQAFPPNFTREALNSYLMVASPGLAAIALMLLLFGFIRGKRGSNRFGQDPRHDDIGMAA
jgi:uncharacterized membrane protein YhaH (DUF805 family)